MILTHDVILKEIKKKRIIIDPFDESAVGPGSVDLSLSDEIRVFKKNLKPILANSFSNYQSITDKKRIDKEFILKKGELILGITKENITLPGDIAGWLNSRSRFARLGMMVHITAPFMQPGTSGRQVLEIYNASNHDLILIPGEKLCQFVFERCEGKAEYKGNFRKQEL
jgi:dCTP deaminase